MNLQPLYDWIFHQNADGSGLTLKTAGLALGVLLLAGHVVALMASDKLMSAAKTFPRNRGWGIALLLVATVWSLFLVKHMDMGEFFTWRERILIIVPVSFVLVVVYVPEFLAVRALGAVLLLASAPILQAAFLQPQTSRLLLPILAYAWIIAGMFFVGMPYLLRDWITWLTQKPTRWKMAAFAGAAYGAAMIVLALVDY
ncbi:MAG: hypothetical protein K8R87_00870 [Verrucomicrobia bacterium]|nr:hypothetical protein [Verrucomicrobiota bacterium]